MHFSSTNIIDKKPHPRRGHSKFRLQCDTEVYCTVLTNTVMIKAKFQNLQDLNSRTFRGFSSTFKHLICFQALLRTLKFLFEIQAFSRISQARYEPCSYRQQRIRLRQLTRERRVRVRRSVSPSDGRTASQPPAHSTTNHNHAGTNR